MSLHPKPLGWTPSRLVSGLLFVLSVLLIGYAVSDDPFLGGEPGFGGTQIAILALGIGLAGCIRLPLRWRGRILLCSVTTLAGLGLAEVALRPILGPATWPPTVRDDRYIFKPLPGGEGVNVQTKGNGGRRVHYSINRDGFRGEELRPPGSCTRVMVYGDSFIEAIYTPIDRTFCKDLERDLGASLSEPIEVINAGVAGYGPDQVLLKLEDELPRFRPDLVIVSIFAGNDYGDLERNKLFRLGPDDGLVPNRYEISEELAVRFALRGRESILKRLIRNLRPRRVAGGGQGTPLQTATEEHEDYFVRNSNLVTNLEVDWYNDDCSLTPNSPSARFRARFMEAVLKRIRETADRYSVPLIFMLIPHPVDVCEDYDGRRVDLERFPEYRPENLTATLVDIAKRNCVAYLDLFEVFRRLDANRLYYHLDDDHWNDEGQRVAARAMSDFVIRHGLRRRGP